MEGGMEKAQRKDWPLCHMISFASCVSGVVGCVSSKMEKERKRKNKLLIPARFTVNVLCFEY